MIHGYASYLFFPQAGQNITGNTLQCLCNHLTSFGGGVVVAPNPIDFDKVFLAMSQLSVTGNVAVLATIISIFLVYFIAVVLARRADKQDEKKVLQCFLLFPSFFSQLL